MAGGAGGGNFGGIGDAAIIGGMAGGGVLVGSGLSVAAGGWCWASVWLHSRHLVFWNAFGVN